MASSTIEHCSEPEIAMAYHLAHTEEEEEELFEIDLEVVDNIPAPHYWESYFTATNNALLANCLLPIAEIASAVPMVVSKACDAALLVWPPPTPTTTVFILAEPVPGKLLRFPSFADIIMILN